MCQLVRVRPNTSCTRSLQLYEPSVGRTANQRLEGHSSRVRSAGYIPGYGSVEMTSIGSGMRALCLLLCAMAATADKLDPDNATTITVTSAAVTDVDINSSAAELLDQRCSGFVFCRPQPGSLSVTCLPELAGTGNASVIDDRPPGGDRIDAMNCSSAAADRSLANQSATEGYDDVTDVVMDACALRCFDPSRLAGVRSLRISLNGTDRLRPTPEENDKSCRSGISDYLGATIAHLDLSVNELDDLSTVCGCRESGVAELDVSGNRIGEFDLGALRCLSRLDRLDFSGNRLVEIGAARHVLGSYPERLRHLDLSANAIRRLSRGAFSHLRHLVVLDLSDNSLTVVEQNTFTCRLDRLQWLSLAGNEIQTLADSAFDGLSDLRTLNISRNRLESLDGRSFVERDAEGDCRDDVINGTSRDANASSAFTSSSLSIWSHFDVIDLSENNITVVDENWFHSAVANCRTILLNGNRLRQFPRYGLERLPRLERLDLGDNQLYWLDVGTFTSRTLRHVDLSRNKLRKIISMTFLFLPAIEFIDLSRNELDFVYRLAFYESCRRGQRFRVDLSDNRLTDDATWPLVSSFRHLIGGPCVVELDVRRNRLEAILGRGRRIYGRHLRLRDAAYFRVWDHVDLNIADNPIRCDCRLVDDVELLLETGRVLSGDVDVDGAGDANSTDGHHLDFWRSVRCRSESTAPTVVAERVRSLSCPSSPSASLRCPYECSCSFDRSAAATGVVVVVVNCTRRGLIAVPRDLPAADERHLHLAQNYVTELNDGPHLENVTVLDLSANALLRIEADALLRLPPSATVFLHDNLLGELPVGVGRFDRRAGQLTLRGNPISCGACENRWLVDWLRNHTDAVADAANVTCDDGRRLLDLADVDAGPSSSTCDGAGSALWGPRSPSVLYVSLAAALALGSLCLMAAALAVHSSRRRVLPVLMDRLSWYRLNLDRESGGGVDQPDDDDQIVLWYSPLDERWVKDNVVDPLGRQLPLTGLCPYHQCLIQNDPGADRTDAEPRSLRSLSSTARCLVVVLSENFLATEWSAFEDWRRRRGSPNILADLLDVDVDDDGGGGGGGGRKPPAFFLTIEPIKLAEHRSLCDLIKFHTSHDISELMWLESLLDAISSLDRRHDAVYNVDWTDEENLVPRDEKH